MSGGSLESLLQHFPRVRCAFAYGSGVFEQADADGQRAGGAEARLVDLMLVVDDAVTWHGENMQRNGAHYAGWLRWAPRVAVGALQGDGVFFNPYVTLGRGIAVKYGVVERHHVVADLLHWHRLYVAGRLHKPVRFLAPVPHADVELRSALDANLDAALRVALLAFAAAEPFSDTALFERIAALSYSGDVRMRFAEHPHKVANIVRGSADHFRRLYAAPIARYVADARFGTLAVDERARLMRFSLSPAQRAACAAALPSALARGGGDDAALAQIVARSSRDQALRGALSAGLFRSARYLVAKLGKRFAR